MNAHKNEEILQTGVQPSIVTPVTRRSSAKLCCSDVLQWTRDIFIEHVTGHRQLTDPSSSSNRVSTNVSNSSVPAAASSNVRSSIKNIYSLTF
ncbi:hypothetical protein AVEN_266035-1 [Araneus ventricosus]|uniref:Uncharacterized protein n=1 Tax=Araneus ventricosus TaxID=182803 RepID=A0A4Y2S5K7_ARAVE|nr:hypothetical protein AVEN_266035-1 [Araneus ventricosus]